MLREYYNHLMEEPRTVPAASMPSPSAEAVARYLAAHPDFLREHADLLPSEAQGQGVVDFQQAMLRRLQGQLQNIEAGRQELLALIRDNLGFSTRVHAGVLALLEAPSFEEMINTLTSDLTIYLDLDAVVLLVEQPAADAPPLERHDIRLVPGGRIDEWLGPHDIALEEVSEGDPEIFGEACALIRSQALLRLQISAHAPLGMLAFGSRSSDLFQTGQSSELIGFLARAVERLARAWLALPE